MCKKVYYLASCKIMQFGVQKYQFIDIFKLKRRFVFYLGSAEKLRRNLILITSGATGGYCRAADQPRSGLNIFIALILNPFMVLAFVFFIIHQFHLWLIKLNPFRI